MISRDVIEAIRDRIDIVEVVSEVVTLKRRGSSLLGLCPFHQEKTPSFNVVPHKGIYHCFGCGEGGDVFAFLQKTRGMSFHEAVQELAPRAGVQIEERELSPVEQRKMRSRADQHEICELACQYFHSVLMTRAEGKVAREYLERRGLTQATIDQYRLGFATPAWDGLLNHLHREGVSPEMAVTAGLARPRPRGPGSYDLFRGRIIVPVEDVRGRVVAFGGRTVPGLDGPGSDGREPPKYVNSPESEIYQKSQVLYGLSKARADVQRKGRLLVVEGYFDVLSLHQAGFKETVATCGTALTTEHVRIIRPLTRKVYALFDLDEAGLRAAVKSMELFLAAEIEPLRLDIRGAKDPDEFVQKNGAEAFEDLLGKSEPVFELVLRRSIARHGSTPGGMNAVVEELAPLIRMFPPVARAQVSGRVGQAFGVADTVVMELVGRRRQVGDATAPARWTGTQELNHLFWLLLHFPAEVGPVVAEADPNMVTDRITARHAIGFLLEGKSLPSVIDKLADPDLARILYVAAAKDELYEQDRAAFAAEQILARMRFNRIRGELASLERKIAACTPDGDRSRYFDLLEQRQALQRERTALQRLSGRKVR